MNAHLRVLLINPAFSLSTVIKAHGGHLIPLNLCYLAAYARKVVSGIEVRILDADALGYSLDETVTEAIKFSPDLIGVTSNTCSFDCAVHLIQFLKRRMPDVRIVLGGSHSSALPERSLRESSADYVVAGEGEMTFSELIQAVKNNRDDFGQIKGLAYLDENGNYHQNPSRDLIADLDILPFPARDLVDNTLYTPAPTKRVGMGPNTMICTSRGCTHNCGFCAAHAVWTRKIRMRSPASIIAEIKECVEKYGITSINISDEFFTANRDRVHRICRLMISENCVIPWVCSARAERLDEETLKIMKEAGCREISFGIESGNPEILKRIDKKLDLNEALRVIRATQRAGIKTHASYILGYMGENVETMKDTICFAKQLNTDVAAFFIASPLPGSRFYNEVSEKGYLRPDASWENYSPLSNNLSVVCFPGLSPETIRYWHRKAIRTYYFRMSYIIARLMRIRHWYEVMNLVGGIKIFFSIRK
ncbi:MAG: radical SAM protein [Kiritimatiellia bacterium]|nr:radical SAM protein [Kiritimatiellia bacterium]